MILTSRDYTVHKSCKKVLLRQEVLITTKLIGLSSLRKTVQTIIQMNFRTLTLTLVCTTPTFQPFSATLVTCSSTNTKHILLLSRKQAVGFLQFSFHFITSTKQKNKEAFVIQISPKSGSTALYADHGLMCKNLNQYVSLSIK